MQRENILDKFPEITNDMEHKFGGTYIVNQIDRIVESINSRTPKINPIDSGSNEEVTKIKEFFLNMLLKRVRESKPTNATTNATNAINNETNNKTNNDEKVSSQGRRKSFSRRKSNFGL